MGLLRLPNQTVALLRFMPPPTDTINSGDIQAFFGMNYTGLKLTSKFFIKPHVLDSGGLREEGKPFGAAKRI
jgi:hypothetical protein